MSESKRNKLEPCPFCGGHADYAKHSDNIKVYCTGLGCYASRICFSSNIDDAINKWNERIFTTT